MRIAAFILGIGLLISCRNSDPGKKEMTDAELSQHLINANRIATHNESEDINEYIKGHGWEMSTSGTGLRYHIDSTGSGKKTELKGKVKIKLGMHMIDGTPYYESKKDSARVFTLGQGELPNGIEEGILMMRRGDKARLLLPSHLGYGLSGDGNEIPPRAVLICNIELIDINKH